MSDRRKHTPRQKPIARGAKPAKSPGELGTDSEVARTLKAIRALQTRGQDLSRDLMTLACSAVNPLQGRPAVLNRHWAQGSGKTWKALREFPTRLERLAREVERINEGDELFYLRRRGKDLTRFELQRLEQNCMQLPTMIRVYAETLRERNATVAADTPRHGRSEALFQLSRLVRFLTGAFHDQQVSELLNAVANALGQAKQFDATGIAQARSRRRRV